MKVIAGMQLIEGLRRLRSIRKWCRLAAKRIAADVRDEHARHGHMAPSEVTGAETQIILFAVTLREYILA